jgi:TRAP-type C4-dicarboxylate transport system permease large subunit
MVICSVLLVVLGCFIDALPLLLLMAPIFYPISVNLGIDAVQFGVLITTVILVGTLTPPVGIMVYALAGVVKEVPMMRIFKGVMPFVLVMVIFTVLIIIFPGLSSWLVTKMFGS